jgi:hypothetical protein
VSHFHKESEGIHKPPSIVVQGGTRLGKNSEVVQVVHLNFRGFLASSPSCGSLCSVLFGSALHHFTLGVSLGLVLTLAQRAQADIVILNPGFEDISVGTVYNEFTFGAPAGWELYDPNNITAGGAGPTYWVGTITPDAPNNTNFINGVPEGNRAAIAFNFDGSGGQGEYGLQQTLSAVLQANSQYTLRVEIGNIASGFAVDGQFFNLDGFPGYRIDLLAGGVVIASDNNSLANSIPEGTFATSTINLLTDNAHPLLGQTLAIRLVNLNNIDLAFPDADLEVDFDHVRMTVSVVPEPSSIAILVACGGFGAFRRCRSATRGLRPGDCGPGTDAACEPTWRGELPLGSP